MRVRRLASTLGQHGRDRHPALGRARRLAHRAAGVAARRGARLRRPVGARSPRRGGPRRDARSRVLHLAGRTRRAHVDHRSRCARRQHVESAGRHARSGCGVGERGLGSPVPVRGRRGSVTDEPMGGGAAHRRRRSGTGDGRPSRPGGTAPRPDRRDVDRRAGREVRDVPPAPPPAAEDRGREQPRKIGKREAAIGALEGPHHDLHRGQNQKQHDKGNEGQEPKPCQTDPAFDGREVGHRVSASTKQDTPAPGAQGYRISTFTGR